MFNGLGQQYIAGRVRFFIIIHHFLLSFSDPWYEDKRIGKNTIGNILPDLCEVANVPRLTNHSIRPTSIRAMRRGGFERSDIQFVSGHKSVDSLVNYDSLTVLDRTKMALAIQKGHATLDGERLDLDSLARGQKRKNDDPSLSTSKVDNPVPSSTKKITIEENDIEKAEFVNDDSGLGDIDNMTQHSVVVKLPVTEVVQESNVGNLPVVKVLQESNASNDYEPPISSSQAHNVAELISKQMSTNKELINNYLSALKRK